MTETGYELPFTRFGPVLRGGRPREGGPDWRRLGMLALAVVLIVGLVGGGATAGLVWLELGQIQRVDISTPFAHPDGDDPRIVASEPVADIDPITERTNILLVGSDSRDGLSDEQLLAIGTEDEGTDLTDTIILLQLDPQRDQAVMLSFPRDLLVERCDGTRGRINAAFYIGNQRRENGGAACLVQTIEDFTRIPIDHYVRINFSGFIQIVDAIDGVRFYLDEPLRDRYAGLDVPAGCVTFDGTRALQFVRARRLDAGGDFGRIARQQRFARELLSKATSLGTLTRPDRLVPLISSVSDTIETDTGLSTGVMVDLLSSMKEITTGGVDVRTVPGFSVTVDGAALVQPVEDEATALFRAFRSGDLLPGDIGVDAAPDELRPEHVEPVTVLNGAGSAGAGQEAADALERRGFAVAEVANAENFGFERSVVIYPPDQQDQAELVAEALGGIATTAGVPEDPLRVIVGSGFDVADLDPPPAPPVTPTSGDDATPEPGRTEDGFRGAELSPVRC